MAFLCQYCRLLSIFFKLKSWRFLFMVVVLAALASNLLLYDIVASWMLRFGKTSLHIAGAKEFHADALVLADHAKYSTELDILADYVSSRGKVEFRDNLRGCTSETDCQRKYFLMLLFQVPGKLAHYIEYRSAKDNRTKLQCQISLGYELYCPYVSYLVGISQPVGKAPNFHYEDTHAFRLLDTIETFKNVTRGNDTICGKDVNFLDVFPRTIMTQMILVIICLVFYLLVSSVTCINELKRSGFLQLQFRRRLSVLSYWMALWTVTLLEMAIFAAALAVGHYFQCTGFYLLSHLRDVAVLSFVHFCAIAAFVFLFTVLTRRTDMAAIFSCLVCIAATGVIVANRIFEAMEPKRDWSKIMYIMLIAPFGYIGEQVYATLLYGLVDYNAIAKLALPVSGGMIAVVVMVTIYLDIVLKTGCGLRLPLLYPLMPRFWRLCARHAVTLEIPAASVMREGEPEELTPVMCVSRIVKSFKAGCCGVKTVALNKFSTVFYQDQITAIVGHNGSGKSTLLQLLTGDRFTTTGQAALHRTLVTDPLFRRHIGSSIGYCPQSDALCDRLTVMDTLKLTAFSSGLKWADVQLDVQHMLSTLQIDDKMNHCISSLSRSDRRKVCVTMALIGKPKIIFLDNPSRDMDYISKRRMWSLLHEYKHGRAIVVSTLFIDEAESIADRILFLACGKIICAGSSFFLRRVFDCRFIIQIASKTEFHVPFIIRKIATKFDEVRVRSFFGPDLELEVSITDDHILPDVVAEVELFSGLIDEFGIANFCLDDVFSKLKNMAIEDIEDQFRLGIIGYLADDYDRILAIKNRTRTAPPSAAVSLRISSSMLGTVGALMAAHLRQTRRSCGRLVVRVVVPVVLLLLLGGAAILEHFAMNGSVQISHNLSNISEFEADKGVCMHFYSIVQTKYHWESIAQGECGRYLSGLNKTNDKVHGLMMDPENADRGFLSSINTYLPQIRSKCFKATLPCPVVYSADWCPHRDVTKSHNVYVGSYVKKESYKAEGVAMTAIEVFRNMISYITYQIAKGTDQVRPEFDVVGIQDIRSIFFPFYGLFVQVALLAVMPAFCLNDVIQDRRSGIRTQLLSMGMSRFHYWFSTLVAHWCKLFIVYLLGTVLLATIIATGYRTIFFLVAVASPTLTFGLVNSLLCAYLVSTVAKNCGYMCICMYAFFCLLVSMSAMLVQTDDFAGQIMILAIPQYAVIAPTFYGVRFIFYSIAFYRATGGGDTPSLLWTIVEEGHIRWALMALVAHFILLTLLLTLMDSRHRLRAFFCSCGARYSAERTLYDKCTDSHIVEEVSRLRNCPKDRDNQLEVRDLKAVNSDGKTVLRNLTFGLKPEDTIALLGPCGSGKSAAVRDIVGDQVNTAGRVDFQFKDRWLSNTAAARQGFIGYCPMYDPQFQRLTVRENLEFYAKSVGVPSERVQQVVRSSHLDADVNTIAMYATAGVRRRLTLAIAILADPKFLAIDEASAGVDPEGRQMLWKNVKSLTVKQRSILVTSQYMEEAETLCNRICIMNGGMMAALSDIDELVHRYRQLYMLEVQLTDCPEQTLDAAVAMKDAVVLAITDKFPGSIVIEQLTSRVQFAIPIKSIGKLSVALRWLVNRKSRLCLLYFSLHFATIDQTMKAIVVHHDNELLRQHEGAGDAVAKSPIV